MSVALIQLLLCVAAGFFLWRLWRSFAAEDPWTRAIVFVGFFGRAVAGVTLFWISYLRLPFLRSLQLGDGLWFFGTDATYYMPTAAAAAREGLDAIIGVPRGVSSVAYVQVLALFGLLFGIVASVALLLNLFCYLGSCAAIVHLRKATPAGRVPGAVALAAISLSPSAVLWSLQPLKDTLFQLLIVAFIAACAMWQHGWKTRPSPAVLTGAAVILLTTLYAISGIRWYFAFAALAAALAFFVLVAVTVPRKAAALAAGLIVFVALTQGFLRGAGAYTPPRIMAMLSFSTPLDTRMATLAPGAFAGELNRVRSSFERAGGDTSISVGKTLNGMERESPTSTPPAVTIASAAPREWIAAPGRRETMPEETGGAGAPQMMRPMTSAVSESEPKATVASGHAPDRGAPDVPSETGAAAGASASPRLAPPASDSHSRAATPASDAEPSAASPSRASAAPPAGKRSGGAPPPEPSHSQPATPGKAEATRGEPSRAVAAHPTPPHDAGTPRTDGAKAAAAAPAGTDAVVEKPGERSAPRRQAESGQTRAERRSRNDRDRDAVDRESPSSATAASAKQETPIATPGGTQPAAAAVPVAVPAPPQTNAPPVVLPQSIAGRIVTGTIAVFVPRSLADRFKLIEIGGGKGLLWFTDLDTLAFDIIVLFGLVYLARRRRWATFRNPTFWLVILIGVLVGVPLAYAIPNFGTLFRLRMMLYTAAALMPLALALSASHREVIMGEAAALPVRSDDDPQDAMKPRAASEV